MKYLQLFENHNKNLKEGEYLIMQSITTDLNCALLLKPLPFLCKILFFYKTASKFKCKIIIPTESTRKKNNIVDYIILCQDIKSGKILNPRFRADFEYKILYRGNDLKAAQEEYNILIDANKFGL